MLVLTRKVHEAIVVARDVRIEIIGVDRGVVRLGITAPKEIRIDREEVLLREDDKEQLQH